MTPWAVASQALLPMEFSMQEYWNRLPFPTPGDLPDPGIEPRSPALQADSLLLSYRGGNLYHDLKDHLQLKAKERKYRGSGWGGIVWEVTR